MTNIQYTIRNIPLPVDRVIRKRAQQTGKSFNQTVVDLLSQHTLGHLKQKPTTNFDWLFNQQTLDQNFDDAINSISKPDPELWK